MPKPANFPTTPLTLQDMKTFFTNGSFGCNTCGVIDPTNQGGCTVPDWIPHQYHESWNMCGFSTYNGYHRGIEYEPPVYVGRGLNCPSWPNTQYVAIGGVAVGSGHKVAIGGAPTPSAPVVVPQFIPFTFKAVGAGAPQPVGMGSAGPAPAVPNPCREVDARKPAVSRYADPVEEWDLLPDATMDDYSRLPTADKV